MTHFWTYFSFLSSRKWGGTSLGPWWPLPRQLQMGTKVGWRGLGDWVGGGWMSRMGMETWMGSPIGPLHPRFIINHSCWAPHTLLLLLATPAFRPQDPVPKVMATPALDTYKNTKTKQTDQKKNPTKKEKKKKQHHPQHLPRLKTTISLI